MRLAPVLPVLCLPLLLCACQATSFQNPPLAEEACDPALAGNWSSVDESGKRNGELQLKLSETCQLEISGSSVKAPGSAGATLAHTARRAGHAYAWFNAGWANRLFEIGEFDAPPDDVYVFRYTVQGQDLLLQGLDHKAVAHKIIDDAIPGTVRSDDNALVNRITGPARPETLELPGLFSTDVSRFTREPAKP